MPLYPAVFSDTADGLVPAPNSGAATKFLREDASWQTAGGSTGSMVYLEHQDASASAQIDFALDSYTDYRNFMIVLENVVPATDAAELFIRFSTDGGSTFISGAGEYAWNYNAHQVGTSISTGSNSDTKIQIAENQSNVAGEGLSGTIHVFDPHSATRTMLTTLLSAQSVTPNHQTYAGSGRALTAQDTTDIRFLMDSGNITSGRFILYGLSLTSVPGGNPTAAEIPFTPTGTIAATDVQAAIAEVVSDLFTRINGSSGAAGPFITVQNLTADSADNTSTTPAVVMTTTGVGAGTWQFKYTVIYQTAATTTGIGFAVNHTGTVGQFASEWRQTTTGTTTANATGDGVSGTAAGQLYESHSERAHNTVTVAAQGVDTANADIMATVEGIIVVTATGSLELKISTEISTSAVRLMADSCLILTKIE